MTLLDAAASGEKVGFLALLGGPATLERPGFANAFLEAISGHRGRLDRGPKVEAEKPLDLDAGPSDVRLGGEPVGQDRLLDRWQDAPGDCLPAQVVSPKRTAARRDDSTDARSRGRAPPSRARWWRSARTSRRATPERC